MWAAFKLLPIGTKIGIAIAILGLLAAAIGGTYYVAYNKGLNVSKLEIAEYKKESEKLRADLSKADGKTTVKVVTEYKDRVHYIDRVVTQTKTVIRDSVPQQFKFSKGWVYAYNQSVRGLPLDPTLASDATPASVSDVEALADTIAPNNGICLANKEQLISLQKWIREVEKNREEITK